MKISWPKGMERWKAVLDRYRYALLVIAAGVLLLLLPTGVRPRQRRSGRTGRCFSSWRSWRRSWPAPCPASMERGDGGHADPEESGSRQVLAQDTQSRGRGAQRLHRDLGRGSGSQEVVPLRPWPQFRGRWWCAPAGTTPGVRLQVIRQSSPDGAGQRLHHRLPGRSRRTAADGTAVEENRIQVEQNIVKMEEWEEFSMKTKGKTCLSCGSEIWWWRPSRYLCVRRSI